MCDQFMTFVTVTKCHKFEFVTEFVCLFCFCSFSSRTGLVTFWSQMVTLLIVTATNLFLFLFRLKLFGMKEIRKNIPENELCCCFLFKIRLGTARRPGPEDSDFLSSPTPVSSWLRLGELENGGTNLELSSVQIWKKIPWATTRSTSLGGTRWSKEPPLPRGGFLFTMFTH